MDPKVPRGRPERAIQDAIKEFLEQRGWFVNETHGNMFQSGFPDLYCTHMHFGQRWVEVKNPEKYEFTKAQVECFTKWAGCGVKIWVMVAATEAEYKKVLSQPPNWHLYLSSTKVVTRVRNKRLIV